MFSLLLMTSAVFKECQSGILQNVFSDLSDILPLIKLRLYALGERKITGEMPLLSLQTMGTCSQDDLPHLAGVVSVSFSPVGYLQLTLRNRDLCVPS